MYRFRFAPSFLLLVSAALALSAAPPPQAARTTIGAPRPGQAVQGIVVIQGTTLAEGFRQAELSFAYAGAAQESWFLITRLDQPVADAPLAEWDTTTLTDGNYTLRLVVTREDGEQDEYLLEGLRVRNYTPIETSTPAPTGTPLPTLDPSLRHTLTPIPPTTTPLPANPAEITPERVGLSAARGGLAALAALVLVGLYLGVRNLLKR
jgi:hypothetical protein